ncbi:Tc toxin subunit A [Pseudescherichia vulneris]|uniref:Tc toxin subunit A n=1 Tax=Pseudescherichia vulneris TaxID=566 RepID=UPI0028D3D918|nr:Tc toxin subunit A [Pseudescherichia vulneris]
MTLSASPALLQVESALKVSPGSFTKNNYRSVFDIARTSRKQFIADNMSWLGLRGGKAWDLAVGQAQHIRRQFRENQLTRQIRQGLPQTLSGQPTVSSTSSNNIQGLVQDGPTWRNQFAENWQAYCQSDAPEAVDSPVSYLTWLYKQALSFEEEMKASSTADQVIPLAERRPDLATLTVDNDAINQQIPALQLVNEILENSIATSLPSEQSVDETLAETRYPTLLPYHFPHDQAELALLKAGVPLEEIISETAIDWPWFLNDAWQGARSASSIELASRLAPEQQTVVIEADNSTGSDLKSFYKANLGLETTDYTPFKDLDIFTYRLGITVPQVEELIAGNAGGTTVTASDNCDVVSITASDYGASFINSDSDAKPVSVESAYEYNTEFMPSDTGSNPIALNLSNTGLSVVAGKFNSGLACDATRQAQVYIADNISTDGSNSKNFTVAFWVKIPSDVPDQAIVVTNKTEQDALASKGITLFTKRDTEDFQLKLTVSDGSKDPLSYSFNVIPDSWNFLVIRYGGSKKLYIRGSKNGVDMNIESSIDFSSLGSIALPVESWGFNGNKGNYYYNAHTERRAVIIFDDITVWNRDLRDDEIENIISSTIPAGGLSDMYHYYALDGMIDDRLTGLSNARMDRINRMVRLQRWLGLSYEETDLLLSACIRAQGTNNTDFTLNAHTLRALGVFRHWQQKYAINAFQFAAVLDEITPYAISPAVPFLDQVFNAPSLFDEPFAITGENVSYTEVTGDSARTVRQICAGLDITQAQFRVLADKVAAAQGDAQAKTFPLTLPVVSALYRLAMVPRWLGLSFADGAALLSLAGEGDAAWTTLAGVQQLAALSNGQPADGDILDLLMALDAAAEWASDHKLSWVKNYLTLQPGSDALAATSATVNFVNGIKQQLPAALLSEQSFITVPLPAGSTVSGWLPVFPDLIDTSGLVQAAATSDSTITALVTTDIDAAGITFASDADREQAISSLSGIINQARLAQNGIADSALAQMFSTGQSLPPYLLSWAGDSEYHLLSDSLAMNNGAALTDPSQVPATYLTDLFALGQRAGISRAFTLTPAALSIFLAHPDWFGVSDTTLSLTLLYRFSRYGDWLTVTGDEDRVLAYLSWVNGDTPPDGVQAADALALLLVWESSEVADATAALPGGLAKTVTDVDYVMRLRQLSTETGLSVMPLLATGELVPGGVTETWDAWQSAGESLVATQQ